MSSRKGYLYPSLGRIVAKDRREPDEPPVLVLYRVRVTPLYKRMQVCFVFPAEIPAEYENIVLRHP